MTTAVAMGPGQEVYLLLFSLHFEVFLALLLVMLNMLLLLLTLP
jgi:hypothetical protein